MTGEAGIGKSTLIKQLMLAIERDPEPPIVARAECSTPVAGSGVGHVEALKPFADIMSGLIEAGSNAATKRKRFKLDIGKFFVDTAPSWIGMIPVIGSPIFHALSILGSGYDQVYLHNKLRTEGANAASNQEQVFRQYINFLSKLSEEVPVLVILDDFHWADTSSTNLLFAAARDLAASKVVFLVVYREDDIKRSDHQSEHPILHVRNEIERYSMSRVIEVPPADVNDIRALLLYAYPKYTPNVVLEKWLLRITDGNLLFATQFLSTLEQDLYLKPESAELLKDLATVTIPSSANAVVVEHMRRLNAHDKEQLRYASVEGETVTANMVSRFLDMPMIKMLQRLRVLAEQHHVIRSLGTQSLYAKETTAFQFVHFLVHKTLYEALTAEERAILHGIATDVLEEELAFAEEAQHNVHIVAARLAAHASVAERNQTAAMALLKGARWVWRSFAADEALYLIDQCQHAVQTQKKPTHALRSVGLDALVLKAEIAHHCARYAEAATCFEEAIELAKGTGVASSPQRCVPYLGLALAKWAEGKFPEAEAYAREALEIATDATDERNRMRALCTIGNTFYSRSMFDQALENYQQSLDASMSIGDEAGRASALSGMGNVYEDQGHGLKALEYHQEALSIRRALLDTAEITRGLVNIGAAMTANRMFDGAMESLAEALRLARSSGALRQEATIMNNMAGVSRHLGRFDEALELVQRSLAIKILIGDRSGVVQSLGTIGNICKDTNRLDEAIDYYTQCIEVASELNNQVAVAKCRYCVAYVQLLQDKPSEALTLFEASRLLFTELGVSHLQIQSAFGSACCSFKLEAQAPSGAIIVKANELLQRTQSLVRAEDFSVAAYERISAEWHADMSKLGITIEVV